MAKRKTAASTEVVNDFAATLTDKIGDQIKTLVGRNWPEINEVLEASEGKEIKLAFATTITHRDATPGEVASKDNRVLTTISFSQKHSDKIESDLPDPAQTELDITGSEPDID